MVVFRVIVRLGEWNTDTGKDCIKAGNVEVCNQEPLDAEVESTLVHEGYDMNNPNRRNDIALVRLKRPVTYTSKYTFFAYIVSNSFN